MEVRVQKHEFRKNTKVIKRKGLRLLKKKRRKLKRLKSKGKGKSIASFVKGKIILQGLRKVIQQPFCYETILDIVFNGLMHDFEKAPKKRYDTENTDLSQLDFSVNEMMFISA